MTPFDITRGDSPLILAFPHSATFVPDGIFAKLTPLGRTLGDTDWHVDRLYDGLLEGATKVRANFHRYVIDANRDPSGASLYPGQNTTGLVPLTNFDGEPLWLKEPDVDEIEARRLAWHAPYHAALEAELQRVKARHGVAILYDCHSIRADIPFLFEGTLPDFNIGTNNGTTCAPHIETAIAEICAQTQGYSSILNGRFKGGWTTRHYGRPADNIHAIQMELAQTTHLKTQLPPFHYDREKAEQLRVHLKKILTTLADIAISLGGKT